MVKSAKLFPQTHTTKFAPAGKVRIPDWPAPPPGAGPYHIDACIAQFVLAQQAQGSTDSTLKYYAWHLRRFVWYLATQLEAAGEAQLGGGAGPVGDIRAIRTEHIRSFYFYLQVTHKRRFDSAHPRCQVPLNPGAIHAFARAVRALCNWAEDEYGIPNPHGPVRMPRVPRRAVEVYSQDELARVFAAIERLGTEYVIARTRAQTAVLIDSGIRAEELLGMTVHQDYAGGVYEVRGKGRKVRRVVLGRVATSELMRYITLYRSQITPAYSDAVWLTDEGTALTYPGLRQIWRRLRELTGIPHCHLHTARHTAGTTWLRNGLDLAYVSDLLGHASIHVTKVYYLSLDVEDIPVARYSPMDNMSVLRPGKAPKYKRGQGPRAARVDLPPAEQLAKEVRESSARAVAKLYGVSDTTIRARLRAWGGRSDRGDEGDDAGQ